MAKIVLTKWNYIFLIVWGLFLTLCLFFYLTFLQPAKIIPRLESVIKEYTNIDVEVSSISLDFIPKFGIVVDNFYVSSKVDNTTISVDTEKLSFHLSWDSLIKFEPQITEISLHEPSIAIELIENSQNKKNEKVNKINFQNIEKDFSHSLKQTVLSIVDASINLQTNGQVYSIKPLSLRMEEFGRIEIFSNSLNLNELLNVQSFPLDLTEPLLLINNMQFNEESLLFDVQFKSDMLLFDESQIHSISANATLELLSDLSLKPFTQDIDLISRFAMPTQNVDTRAKLRLEHENFKSIKIPSGSIEVEDNHIEFSGSISELSPNFKARANVYSENLGLTRWLSFARNLTPTLSNILNELIVKGEIFFENTSIFANNLEAKLGGYDFKGLGKYVYDGNHRLDLSFHTNNINLDTVFPEPLGKEVKPLEFENLPIDTEIVNLLNSNPDYKSTSTFSYNIAISADKAKYYKFYGNKIFTHILPDANGKVQIPVSIEDIAKGKVEATVLLGSKDLVIDGKTSKIAIENILDPFIKNPPIQGRFDGTFNLKGEGDNIAEAFAQMLGKGSVELRNGNFVVDKKLYPFNVLQVDTKITANTAHEEYQDKKRKIRSFLNEASIKLNTNDYEAHLTLPKTNVVFDRKSLELQDISTAKAQLNMQIKNPLLLEFTALGDLVLDYPNQSIDYIGIEGSGKDINLYGDVFLTSFSAPKITGDVTISNSNFFEFMKTNGWLEEELKDKNALRYFKIKLPFELQNSIFSAKNINLQLDDTNANGNIFYDISKEKTTVINLQGDRINIDRYTKKANAGKTNDPPFNSSEEIPLELLKALDMQGILSFDELWLAGIPFLRANIPYSLIKGEARLSATASFPTKGSMAFDSKGKVYSKYFMLDTRLKAQDIDLLALTKMRGNKLLMAGTASIEAQLANAITSYNDILDTLEGQIEMKAVQGYFVDAQNNHAGEIERLYPLPSKLDESASKMRYSLISATATVTEGLVTSSDLKMSGDHAFTGYAKINLPKWTLDLQGNLTYANFAHVPVNVSGSLSEPNLKVKILEAFAAALEAIGSGVLNILTTPLKLLPK